jgi:hypothetical protein
VGRVKLKLLKMKKVMFTAFAVGLSLTASVVAQVPSYVPTNGLVGYWPFNGNANDESGNGNNGTVNGATLTTDRFGVANKAYNFDGLNDYISSTDIGISANSQRSLSFWAKTASSSTMALISWGGNGMFPNNGQRFCCVFNYIAQGVTADGGDCAITYTPNISVSNNQWNYYTLTMTTGSNLSQVKVFQNGVLLSVVSHSYYSSILLNTLANTILQFGRVNYPGFSNLYYNGSIDDIGIWNRALSECEIQDLYNSQLGSFSNTNVSVNPTSSSIGSNSTLTVNSTISSLQWQSNPGNMGWNNVVDNGIYNGANNDTLVVSNLQLSNHNQPFRVMACGDTSNVATIQIADTCITNVTVYDTLLTTVTDTLVINTTLGLPAPNSENTILIYPNPASDHITIDNGNFAAMAGYTIKIENNAGQQVFQSLINQAQFYVDLSTWTGNGLYFVHLIDPQNNTVTVRKIVLQ